MPALVMKLKEYPSGLYRDIPIPKEAYIKIDVQKQ
jgi:hypothetical protein